jgi:hypothetical protein
MSVDVDFLITRCGVFYCETGRYHILRAESHNEPSKQHILLVTCPCHPVDFELKSKHIPGQPSQTMIFCLHNNLVGE